MNGYISLQVIVILPQSKKLVNIGKIVRYPARWSSREDAGRQHYDVVRVGRQRLIGEIEMRGDLASIQVYETAGLGPGIVESTGAPLGRARSRLSDYMRRHPASLEKIREKNGATISAASGGSHAHDILWLFVPEFPRRPCRRRTIISVVQGGSVVGT